MIKVQSLKNTVIVQFLVILLPVVALLAYQTVQNAERTAHLDHLANLNGLALSANERYVIFSNGAADAVDTSTLSRPALAALRDAQQAMQTLGQRSGSIQIRQTAEELLAIHEILQADPSLKTLLTLRERLQGLRLMIDETQATMERQLNELIKLSIARSAFSTRLVIIVSVAVLLLTIWCIYRMIRYLSQPLELAVSIADRIADGGDVDTKEFNLRLDVGNLIRSLGRMYRSLKSYESEAKLQRGGLEEKIDQLADSQAHLAEAQHMAKVGNWHWQRSTARTHWSDEMRHILGIDPKNCAPGWLHYLRMVDQAEQGALRNQLRALMKKAGNVAVEHHITTPDGLRRAIYSQTSSLADADGRIVRLYGTVQDISERKAAEAKMHHLAMYDTLTGLPNRQLFRDQLELTLLRAKRCGGNMAVLFIDLDRFKRINDTLGHPTGDLVLRGVAARLCECVRDIDGVMRAANDTDLPVGRVARLAGDEFIVTLDSLRQPEDAARVAARIVAEMARPFLLNGEELVVTASVGIAIYPRDGEQSDILVKNADIAMYQAKELGKNTFQFFSREMTSLATQRLKMENELRHALERNELLLFYQPKINVTSGRITGVEALIRWQNPERGLVPPGVFIPIAEEIGLIVAIGEWVLEEACRQKKVWREAGFPDIDLAINLASPSFRKADLVERVGDTLRRYGVPPGELCVEATESILMRDADATLVTLNRLSELGVRLSVDDFGTGYSSLSYLRRFPINQLKIDQSFVKDVTSSPDDAAIIAAIASLARTLKLEVVAEGIETAEQAHCLIEQGCFSMQGFFFCHPLPANEITQLIASDVDYRCRLYPPDHLHVQMA